MKKKQCFGLFALFFLSGFAALIYQVSWQRALFTLLGSNIESTTIIVTVFMLGLGCGTYSGGKLSSRFPGRIILIFAFIEISIGIYGLFSLPLIHQVAKMPISSQGATIIASLTILLIPTLLMGASLPLLTGHINNFYNNAGISVGGLYLYNILGAALASIAAVLIFFEALGLSGTITAAAIVNLLVGASAFFLLRRRS